jgi:hypothetical protein
MEPPTPPQSSPTRDNSSRNSRPSSKTQLPASGGGPSAPGEASAVSGGSAASEAGARDETSLGPEPRLPSRVAPFDLGDGKDQIIRALELNRQLLLAAKREPLVDEPAVRAKIDELLGRLLKRG